MKNFLCIKFVQSGTNDTVCQNWMLGTSKCYWPPDGSDVQKLVKEQQDTGSSWKIYSCEILCQASKYRFFFEIRVEEQHYM